MPTLRCAERHELESRMHRKVHVRFGRGEREKDRQRHLARLPTSPGDRQRMPEGLIRSVPELATIGGYQVVPAGCSLGELAAECV